MSTLGQDTAITLKVGFPASFLVILMGQERTSHYGQVGAPKSHPLRIWSLHDRITVVIGVKLFTTLIRGVVNLRRRKPA